MKRHVQYPGVRKWSGDDLLELQSEGLRIADGFFAQYGNCVICGCAVSGDGIAAGMVSIDGMTLPLTNTKIEVFPVYLVKDEEHIQREYADDHVRDIAVRYFAKVVQTKPTDAGYIEITSKGTDTFFDKLQATWLANILKQLESLNKADKSLTEAIASLKKADTEAGERLTALEKKMPSLLDHAPSASDDGYDIGTEVWTVDESGNKVFWKCHDNAKGKAVWKRTGEDGNGGFEVGRYLYAGGILQDEISEEGYRATVKALRDGKILYQCHSSGNTTNTSTFTATLTGNDIILSWVEPSVTGLGIQLKANTLTLTGSDRKITLTTDNITLHTQGSGDKYLADDGTYQEVEAGGEYLAVSPNNLVFGKEGGEKTVDITSNAAWEANIE